MSSILSIQDVSFKYPNEKEGFAVNNVSLEIKEGEFVVLIGPSGCGKSTVLNMLAGLLHPSEGHMFFNDEKINGTSLERGVVFQNYSLFPWMSARENILLALKQIQPRLPKKELEAEVLHLLERVSLKGSENKYPSELSGGMQQRVALARLFALNSPVFLMDEPFGAVDAVVRASLQNCLNELWMQKDQQKTIVLVTHDIDEAILLADRIVVFSSGPGRIQEIIPVSFSRPRERNSLFRSTHYGELRSHLMELLHQGESFNLKKGAS